MRATSKVTLALSLLIVLGFLLIFAGWFSARYAADAWRPSAAVVMQAPAQAEVDSPLPAPSVRPTEEIIVITPPPDGGVVNLPPAQPWQVYVFPTPLPPSTVEPPPTPTIIPGPTVTPLPLRSPAPDAAGYVAYSVIDSTPDRANPSFHHPERVTIYIARTDAQGLPEMSPTQLTDAALPVEDVAYAPDGSRILVVGEWGNRWVIYSDSGKVEPVFRDGADPVGLFFGWHPDSRHLLIGADLTVESGLWLVDVDTGEHVTLLQQTPHFSLTSGAVSADGQKVIYALKWDFEMPGELWMVNANGSDPQLLQKFGGAVVALTWSPDNRQVAFYGDGLMVMNADGSNLRTLSRNIRVDYGFGPVWSPDSTMLAFINYEVPTEEVNVFAGNTIRLVDASTGEEQLLLTDGSTGNIDPAWSPDGKQLAFVSTRSGASEVWLVNVDGTNLRQLTTQNQRIRFPFWGKEQ
ncbi:MAG: PD40 domain-containing protein [Caldilineaceae bacterium]|jgi:Tol biopolymer transport system component|nr:PD40 domain-containing protein [Caldilineaceae bacterium]